MPRYYDVNVRAVVRATRIDPEATGDIPDWEVYDTDVEERDRHDLATVAVFRCDQVVRDVEASHPEAAAQSAMLEATAIRVEGWEIDSVELWVDLDNDDVELAAQTVVRR